MFVDKEMDFFLTIHLQQIPIYWKVTLPIHACLVELFPEWYNSRQPLRFPKYVNLKYDHLPCNIF